MSHRFVTKSDKPLLKKYLSNCIFEKYYDIPSRMTLPLPHSLNAPWATPKQPGLWQWVIITPLSDINNKSIRPADKLVNTVHRYVQMARLDSFKWELTCLLVRCNLCAQVTQIVRQVARPRTTRIGCGCHEGIGHRLRQGNGRDELGLDLGGGDLMVI